MALAQDMLAGAQLVNMGWQRQERMQELRAQQAMNQIRERELAAQAEMLTAHSELYRQQAKMAQDAKEQETADLLAAQDYYHQLTETTDTTPEQARAQVDSVLTYKNPALGLKIQKIRTEEARQKKYLQQKEVDPLTAQKTQAEIDLRRAQQQKAEAETKQITEGVKPLVAEIDGQKVIYNPKTGRYEKPDKGITRQKFVNDHFNTMLSNEGDPEVAIQKLKKIYDENFSDGGGAQSAPKSSAKTYNPVTRRLE